MEIWTGRPGDLEVPGGGGRNHRDMGQLGAPGDTRSAHPRPGERAHFPPDTHREMGATYGV